MQESIETQSSPLLPTLSYTQWQKASNELLSWNKKNETDIAIINAKHLKFNGIDSISIKTQGWLILGKIHQKLNEEQLKSCEFFVQIIKNGQALNYLPKPELPEAISLLTEDIINQEIVTKLDKMPKELASLQLTCRFFYRNSAVEALKENALNYKVYAGQYHTIFLDREGNLFGCGSNQFGQLGLGKDVKSVADFTAIPLPLNEGEFVILVAIGPKHTIVLTSQGRLFGCGTNNESQLGPGYQNRYTMTKLPDVPLNQDELIIMVTAGEDHTLILTNQGRMFGCGSNGNHQLGLNDTKDYETMEEICPLVLKGKECFVSVTAGFYHSLALTNQGAIFGFGRNKEGQLGFGDDEDIPTLTKIPMPLNSNEVIVMVSAGFMHSVVLTNQSRVFACGSNVYTQSGLANPKVEYHAMEEIFILLNSNERVTMVTAGGFNTMALTNQGRVFWCGFELNNEQKIATSKEIPILSLEHNEYIVHVTAGQYHHTIALSNQGRGFSCEQDQCEVGNLVLQPSFTLMDNFPFKMDKGPDKTMSDGVVCKI